MVSAPHRRRAEYVPIAVCLLTAVGLSAVSLLGLLARPTLLRAGFTLVGAVVALVLFVASRGEFPDADGRVPASVVTKVVLALAGGAVVATSLLGSRLLPFAVVLPLGIALAALQIRADPSVPAVLTQLSALFLAGRLGKYLTTGFYFGGTDTFAHVAAVETLVEARYTTAIAHGYDLYPVFHFFVGTVTHLTRLGAYDALVLTGILLFTLVVPLAYLLGASVFGSTRLGLTTALSVLLLEFFSYHALYFYPQALASLLLLVGIYVNSRLLDASDERTYRRLSVFALLLVGTMVVTHHLTYLLFAGVAAAAVPVALARPSLLPTASGGRWPTLRYRWLFPGVVGGALLLAYWSYSPSLIVVGIVELSLGVLFDVATVPPARLYTYGVTLPGDSVGRAVQWLSTPTGVYAAGLGSLLLLAAYELLDHLGRYRRGFTLAVTGLGLSALLLPFPIPIPQIERLKFVVTLVAVFPLAVGLRRALAVDGRYVAVTLLVVASLGGATAFTVLAADDVEGVYTDERREQVSMTDAEFRAIGTTAAFVETYASDDVATDRVTNRAFETADYNATRVLRARPSGLRTGADFVVVRERWTDHLVALGLSLRSSEQNVFTLSEERFAATEARSNVVYATDAVRVYHSPDGFRGLYGENGTAATNATGQ
ncbi:hypothetical protein [Haloarcula pellucida]|uniref:Dolichyl-phosphate-mannose-protein mannosyltransferase n=1 Tax=Haloarcula pellucida TaxID=1427151 RepID=A0A830GRG8_9EURY|nr:hypothetical protein [Halomicroarcula pellucida]MBX0350221.1 hypothetical protein [Halomicroarcula pellucida]GGO00986.1 hypothetical protein GCM10009030_34200 [Halomicroarcula pellucida]